MQEKMKKTYDIVHFAFGKRLTLATEFLMDTATVGIGQAAASGSARVPDASQDL